MSRHKPTHAPTLFYSRFHRGRKARFCELLQTSLPNSGALCGCAIFAPGNPASNESKQVIPAGQTSLPEHSPAQKSLQTSQTRNPRPKSAPQNTKPSTSEHPGHPQARPNGPQDKRDPGASHTSGVAHARHAVYRRAPATCRALPRNLASRAKLSPHVFRLGHAKPVEGRQLRMI